MSIVSTPTATKFAPHARHFAAPLPDRPPKTRRSRREYDKYYRFNDPLHFRVSGIILQPNEAERSAGPIKTPSMPSTSRIASRFSSATLPNPATGGERPHLCHIAVDSSQRAARATPRQRLSQFQRRVSRRKRIPGAALFCGVNHRSVAFAPRCPVPASELYFPRSGKSPAGWHMGAMACN